MWRVLKSYYKTTEPKSISVDETIETLCNTQQFFVCSWRYQKEVKEIPDLLDLWSTSSSADVDGVTRDSGMVRSGSGVEGRLTLAAAVVNRTFVSISSETDRTTPSTVCTLVSEANGAPGHVTVSSGSVVDGGVVPFSPSEDFGSI